MSPFSNFQLQTGALQSQALFPPHVSTRSRQQQTECRTARVWLSLAHALVRYKVWPWLRWWKSTTPKWLWRDSHIPALDLLHWAETLLQLKENKSKSPQRMHCIQQKLKLQRSSCWVKKKKLPPWSPKKSPGDSSARSLGRVWINFSPVAPKGKIIKLFHTHYRLISVISVSNQNNPRE